MPISGYFDQVFANDGDLNTVPDAAQPSGSVSYNQGFPILYSTPVGSGGLLVPRTAFNQLFYDVTAAIQNWQQNTIAPFITSTMNGGSPYSYSQYNMVLHGGVAYISLQNSNTDAPPSGKWAALALGAPILSVKLQTFFSSGTYTPSAGMAYCIAETVGAGAGGGGSTGGGASTASAGGGGGGGGYSRGVYTAATIGSSQTVTIGAGGAAGTSGGGAGGNGGTSSLGSLLSSNGGSGGAGATSTSAVVAATGGGSGAGGSGSFTITGSSGGTGLALGSTSVAVRGNGGGSSFGAGPGRRGRQRGHHRLDRRRLRRRRQRRHLHHDFQGRRPRRAGLRHHHGILHPVGGFMAYVLIDGANTVVNVIVYDGTAEYTPPAGQTLKEAPDGTGIGWTYAGSAFHAPDGD